MRHKKFQEDGLLLRRGFTLIELLIVVAIIAILAAIAVPNFLEAQVRSKVSRVSADQRSVATALESYAVDYNRYPPEGNPNVPGDEVSAMPDAGVSLIRLTTPVAYITSLEAVSDPFLTKGATGNGDVWMPLYNFFYTNYENFKDVRPSTNNQFEGIAFRGWGLASLGPDREDQGYLWSAVAAQFYGGLSDGQAVSWGVDRVYDATNGTVSRGDIGRFGGAVPASVAGIMQRK